MAQQIKIDISDGADETEGFEKFLRYHGYQNKIVNADGVEVANPVGKKEFARQKFVDFYNNALIEQTNREALSAVEAKGQLA